MKENLDQLVENYFTPKEEKLDTDVLLGLIAEALTSTTPPTKENIQEESQARFSVTIPLPTMTPSEAWGDPESQRS